MSDSPNPQVNLVPIEGSQALSPIETSMKPTKALSGEMGSTELISTMAELKEKAPELYKATLKSVASTILGQMERHQTRLKKIMRDNRQA